MKKELLDILVCPDDRSALAPADPQLLERINAAIAAGRLKNQAGQTLDRPLEGALVRVDARVAYPILDEIPRLLVDEAILLSQLDR